LFLVLISPGSCTRNLFPLYYSIDDQPACWGTLLCCKKLSELFEFFGTKKADIHNFCTFNPILTLKIFHRHFQKTTHQPLSAASIITVKSNIQKDYEKVDHRRAFFFLSVLLFCSFFVLLRKP